MDKDPKDEASEIIAEFRKAVEAGTIPVTDLLATIEGKPELARAVIMGLADLTATAYTVAARMRRYGEPINTDGMDQGLLALVDDRDAKANEDPQAI